MAGKNVFFYFDSCKLKRELCFCIVVFEVSFLNVFCCFLFRFKHENKSLYAKSERFVGDITHFLSDAFPLQMAQLWKNLTTEGLPKVEGVFAQTPFTGVAITKDYNCAPHLDSSDYGFSFVLWLHSGRL